MSFMDGDIDPLAVVSPRQSGSASCGRQPGPRNNTLASALTVLQSAS